MSLRLLDGEECLFLTRPHWRRLIAPAVVLILISGLAGFAAGSVPAWSIRSELRWAIVAVAGIGVVWGSLLPFLRWSTTTYALTTRRLVVRDGVLVRRGRDVPLSRVTDVSFRQGPIDRAFGSGVLVVESGGEQPPLVLRDLPDVEEFQRQLTLRLVSRQSPKQRPDRLGS